MLPPHAHEHPLLLALSESPTAAERPLSHGPWEPAEPHSALPACMQQSTSLTRRAVARRMMPAQLELPQTSPACAAQQVNLIPPFLQTWEVLA